MGGTARPRAIHTQFVHRQSFIAKIDSPPKPDIVHGQANIDRTARLWREPLSINHRCGNGKRDPQS
jgi:hypothetical protein